MSKTYKQKHKPKHQSKRNKPKRNKSTIHSIIDNSLYPFWYNKIPFPQVLDNKELVEEKTWNKQLKLASKLYKDKSSLPKGTILFHGSEIINPIANISITDKPFFFGLDAFIAIWYISEFAEKHTSNFERVLSSIEDVKKFQENEIKHLATFDTSKWKKSELDEIRTRHENKIKKIIQNENKFTSSIKSLMKSLDKDGIVKFWVNEKLEKFSEILSDLKLHNRRYYFLNIYEIQENIQYEYLGDSIIYQNPLDEEKCTKNACMHPQFGYHLSVLNPPVELSMEFTIPANQIGNKLKLIGVYVIDILKLIENKNKNFNEFKAIESIVLKSDFTK